MGEQMHICSDTVSKVRQHGMEIIEFFQQVAPQIHGFIFVVHLTEICCELLCDFIHKVHVSCGAHMNIDNVREAGWWKRQNVVFALRRGFCALTERNCSRSRLLETYIASQRNTDTRQSRHRCAQVVITLTLLHVDVAKLASVLVYYVSSNN